MRLVSNDTEQPVTNLPGYWGELLRDLDHAAEGRGQVVTAVRFDGVDRPTCRQPAQIGRGLGGVTPIELDTATSASPADNAQAQGAGVLGSAFRNGDPVEANPRPAEFGVEPIFEALRQAPSQGHSA
jgi:hypothetical protein